MQRVWPAALRYLDGNHSAEAGEADAGRTAAERREALAGKSKTSTDSRQLRKGLHAACAADGVWHIAAPAKLNLSLAVTGKKDGYHLLDSVMQEIDLADELEIVPAPETVLEVVSGDALPPENTVTRAAELFRRAAQVQGGARIRLHKRIPAAAGLGGGSSDAAAVLTALNEIYGNPLSGEQLAAAALAVGADCPFFLRGGTQRARGVGEILSPAENRCDLPLLLVKPEKGVQTGPAFALADRLAPVEVDMDACLTALRAGDREAYFAAAGNALQAAAEQIVPEISRLGHKCRALGALFWQVTGSGSTIFAVFADDAARDRAAALLKRERNLFVRAVRAAGGPAAADAERLAAGSRQALEACGP